MPRKQAWAGSWTELLLLSVTGHSANPNSSILLLGVLDTAQSPHGFTWEEFLRELQIKLFTGEGMGRVEFGEGWQSRYTSVPDVPREPKLQPL